MSTQQQTSAAHPNVQKLRTLYADLSRIGEFVADDMVLHTAHRELCRDRAAGRVVGRAAAATHERELIRMTGGTLQMDVQHIFANDHFGAAFGLLRAHLGGASLAMPFCGVWRFRGGLITEHWENAYDVASVMAFLGDESGAPPA
ncbi:MULTISPECIES: nuclear transport factor 2 family protein [Sorangium]|uniref:SnoaL-like domain-containing protein n=2 Tax=Sorangium TaxID=39643 RepID=A0A3Q8I257_SORCE|nr:nuclear transport factor 2 family protein [Sorangium aterium]AYM52893.1 hypothetical protein [Sorangium cellulosum]MDC0684799.1 nuclear transport factor 2 family protein [Sorangium aterium]